MPIKIKSKRLNRKSRKMKGGSSRRSRSSGSSGSNWTKLRKGKWIPNFGWVRKGNYTWKWEKRKSNRSSKKNSENKKRSSGKSSGKSSGNKKRRSRTSSGSSGNNTESLSLVDCLIALENYINKHKGTQTQSQSDLIYEIQQIQLDIFTYYHNSPRPRIKQQHKSTIKDVKLKSND